MESNHEALPLADGKSLTMEHQSAEFLVPDRKLSRACVLIILNFEIPRFTAKLWDRAQLRVCADGGANRLYDELPLQFPEEDPVSVRKRYKPDVIKGDLDSIRPEVREFYQSLSTLLVVGALGGRFDHELGNINVLYTFPNTRIVLLSDYSLVYLLPKTHCHVISIDSKVEGPHCGIVPVGSPSSSTITTGLKWNLSNTPMKFGSLISTSNIILEEKVTVESDVDLIWTSSIQIL